MSSVSVSSSESASSVSGFRIPRGVKSAAIFVTAATALFVGGMGFLHTPLGRPLLAKLGIGCPITKASPQAIDHARSIPALAYLGKPSAPARPVLGFEFEKTTLSEVESWAKANVVKCEKLNGNETLRACSNVPATALGEPATFAPAEEVDFEFRASRTLAVMTVLRRGLDVAQANAMTARVSKTLRAELGQPSKSVGENTPAHFAKGPLQAYQEEYEFGDYAATLTETRIGNTGILLREHYFSPNP